MAWTKQVVNELCKHKIDTTHFLKQPVIGCVRDISVISLFDIECARGHEQAGTRLGHNLQNPYV